MPNNSSPQVSGEPLATIRVHTSGTGTLTFTIAGRLDSTSTGSVWREAMEALQQTSPTSVVVDVSKIEYCDMSGISLLVELRRLQKKRGGDLEIKNLRAEFRRLLDLFDPSAVEGVLDLGKAKPTSFTEEIGRWTVKVWEDLFTLVAFVGELGAALLAALVKPQRVRWKDALVVAETAGVNALPIVALISFLVGLIMAFQAAIPMRQFGVEIFVADLVGLSMVRELGPLMTAILLAGRSGSAFAAELGTMKVTEEIDALTTMGLDPVRFLAVSRVLAALVVTPLLTVFSNLLGVLGGSVVLLSMGYPLITYFNQILSSVDYVDFLGGLIKAFVFGILVAGIGCLRGLQTKTGPSAVGESTTRAVVSGIILIVIADGVFSVLYYYLGI